LVLPQIYYKSYALLPQTGVSTDKLENLFRAICSPDGEAAVGTGAAAATYQRLGIAVLEADGSMRDSGAVLNDVAKCLRKHGVSSRTCGSHHRLIWPHRCSYELNARRGAKGIEEYKAQAQALGIGN